MVFRGKTLLDAAIIDPEGCPRPVPIAEIHLCAAAPGQDFGIALHRVDQREHLLRRVSDQHRFIDLRHFSFAQNAHRMALVE